MLKSKARRLTRTGPPHRLGRAGAETAQSAGDGGGPKRRPAHPLDYVAGIALRAFWVRQALSFVFPFPTPTKKGDTTVKQLTGAIWGDGTA